MADDKSLRDGRDRSRVAGEQPYEVSYFARKHHISQERARSIIERFGSDRPACDAAAKRMNG
jgi:Protein of unknown function (DUF3606)